MSQFVEDLFQIHEVQWTALNEFGVNIHTLSGKVHQPEWIWSSVCPDGYAKCGVQIGAMNFQTHSREVEKEKIIR